MSTKGTSFLGDMLPEKFLKICVSKMAISSILRQISYSSNNIFFARKLCFCKIKSKGGGGEQHSPPPGSSLPFDSTTAKIESDCDCDVHLCWQSLDDF